MLAEFLRGRTFAISPPLQLSDSVYVGVCWGGLDDSLSVSVRPDDLPFLAQSLFAPEGSEIYVHALKEIIKWFAYRKIEITSDRVLDVSIAAYLLNPPEPDRGENSSKFLLKSLMWEYLGEAYSFLPLEIRKRQFPEAIHHRVRQDAVHIQALGERITPLITEDADLNALYREVEMPLVPVLAEMEQQGIRLRRKWIARARWDLEMACLVTCQDVEGVYGQPINPFSDDEVKDFLREVCGARLAKSETVTDDMLKGLSRIHPIVRKLWIWRKLLRALDLFKVVHGKDTSYPTWWMTRASVGRIVCTDPPVQSVPKAFRIFLSPGKGNVFLKADFSAFQLRLLAHLSLDWSLCEVLWDGEDPHTQTMNLLNERGIPIDRNEAKVVNFSLCYGGTAWSLQYNLGVPLKESLRITNELKQVYPTVSRFLDDVAVEVAKKEPPDRFVRSLFGRRRCFNHDGALTARERRQIRNAVVQMLEVDVFKKSVLAVYRRLKEEGLPVRIALLLHDGIWFTCPKDNIIAQRAKEVIQDVMENTVFLNVPLKVDWQ